MTPDEFTIQETFLEVGDGHTLYVHDWGNKAAKTPILFLHGGPGGGCNDGHKGYFNPKKHRVIFFDQRGAGKSTPTGTLSHNTTADLINDIDTIRNHFGFDSIILMGRSWGSTLALTYAITYPSVVHAIITGGVMLGSHAEQTILERTNISELFYPDVVDPLGLSSDQAMELWHKAASEDANESKKACYTLSQLLVATLRLDDRTKPLDFETFDHSGLRVEAHYKINNWFLEDDFILRNASKLTMPVWIIQGRYDMACLPKFAHAIHSVLPSSKLIWTQAGHSGSDRENWLATKTILEQL